MKTILEKYRCDSVWHFTARANLESIREHGLLSFAEAQRRGIEIPEPGGNDWSHSTDKSKGLDAYVHLAFVDKHPMLYVAQEHENRILDPVWLKIDSSVILGDEVRFCAAVANTSGAHILTAEEAQEAIDFDVLFIRMNWKVPAIQERLKKARKSEILVPDRIPYNKILDTQNG